MGQVSDDIAAAPRSPLLGRGTAGSWEEGCQAGGNENPQLSPWWSRKRKPRCRPKAIPDFSYGLLASSKLCACDLRLKLGGLGGAGGERPEESTEPAEGGEAAERLGGDFQRKRVCLSEAEVLEPGARVQTCWGASFWKIRTIHT